jgi:transcriptional regulator with XRE-family HTH domain
MAAALAYRQSVARPGERITQKALADACGVKPPSVVDWFNGDTKTLDGTNLIAAAKFLRVRPEWLASGDGPMTNNEWLVRQDSAPYEDSPPLAPAPALDVIEASETDWAMLTFFKLLPEERRQELLAAVYAETAGQLSSASKTLARLGITATAPAGRVSEVLPQAPAREGEKPRTVRMIGRKKP